MLSDLGISIIEDKMKRVVEEEMQLATEYPNTLSNEESLLTAVGFSYFVGHMATVLQRDPCWNCTSEINSSVGLICLSASYSLLRMAWGTKLKCVPLM